ncbi:MAG: hypothetical protein ACTSYK_03040, partial [Alphaproteobacteria bacterium]
AHLSFQQARGGGVAGKLRLPWALENRVLRAALFIDADSSGLSGKDNGMSAKHSLLVMLVFL